MADWLGALMAAIVLSGNVCTVIISPEPAVPTVRPSFSENLATVCVGTSLFGITYTVFTTVFLTWLPSNRLVYSFSMASSFSYIILNVSGLKAIS